MHEPTPSNSRIPASRPRLALRFISGKYQGGEFPMVPDKEIIVGRSSDLDMVLVEDMVSRKHARIAYENEQIVIEDLGSTNGTFVNGEKIRRAHLKEGDRVLIGTSILKVIATQDTGPTEQQARQNLADVAEKQSAKGTTRTMSGSLEEVPLPDLLQLFATSKKTGVLVLRNEGDVGQIYLQKGIVAAATINDASSSTMKSVFRMLTWQTGLFDLEPAGDGPIPEGQQIGVQEILMESLRQLDEFNIVRDKLPPPTARLVLSLPVQAPLRALGPEDLDVLQLALNHGRVQAVFDAATGTDLQTAQGLLKLLDKRYLRAE
jgi:pSer/pThr/pTyr-binding forkhead associated (FHA) protein